MFYTDMLNLKAETRRVYSNNLGARLKGLPATLTLDEWIENIALFEGKCAYCQISPFGVLDHLVPEVAGGGTTAENCVPACSRCNSHKTGRILCKLESSFEEKIEQVRYALRNNIHVPKADIPQRTRSRKERLALWFPEDDLNALRLLAQESGQALETKIIDVIHQYVLQHR